jgi:hypothetical protein
MRTTPSLYKCGELFLGDRMEVRIQNVRVNKDGVRGLEAVMNAVQEACSRNLGAEADINAGVASLVLEVAELVRICESYSRMSECLEYTFKVDIKERGVIWTKERCGCLSRSLLHTLAWLPSYYTNRVSLNINCQKPERQTMYLNTLLQISSRRHDGEFYFW